MKRRLAGVSERARPDYARLRATKNGYRRTPRRLLDNIQRPMNREVRQARCHLSINLNVFDHDDHAPDAGGGTGPP